MKRTRALAIVLLALMALSIIAGCSSKPSGSNAPAPAKKEPVKLTMWAYAPDNLEAKKALESIQEDFNKANTDIQIEIAAIPKDAWDQKLNTAIAGGVAPDISYLDQPLVPKWAKEATLLDLTPYADGKDGLDRKIYVPGALNTNLVGGKLYGVPLSMTAVALFYNKDLVPTPPATWDEWLAISKKVYVKGKVSAFEGPWGGGWGAWLFPAFAGTNGCYMSSADNSKVTFNEPQCVETAKFLNQIFQYNDMDVITSQEAFGAGKIAMKVSGPWDMAHYKQDFPKLNFGVALIPKKTQYASNIGGENLVVYKSTKNPEAAFKAIKWLTNVENSAKFAKVTGNFPVTLKAQEDPKWSSDPNMKVFAEQMKYALSRPQIDEWLKINDELLGSILDDMVQKGKDPKPLLDDAAAKANALIKK
ncbi:MAG TPA: ABC transporter substrate-binding protein [Symbiobacteriaceae bacterium]